MDTPSSQVPAGFLLPPPRPRSTSQQQQQQRRTMPTAGTSGGATADEAKTTTTTTTKKAAAGTGSGAAADDDNDEVRTPRRNNTTGPKFAFGQDDTDEISVLTRGTMLDDTTDSPPVPFASSPDGSVGSEGEKKWLEWHNAKLEKLLRRGNELNEKKKRMERINSNPQQHKDTAQKGVRDRWDRNREAEEAELRARRDEKVAELQEEIAKVRDRCEQQVRELEEKRSKKIVEDLRNALDIADEEIKEAKHLALSQLQEDIDDNANLVVVLQNGIKDLLQRRQERSAGAPQPPRVAPLAVEQQATSTANSTATSTTTTATSTTATTTARYPPLPPPAAPLAAQQQATSTAISTAPSTTTTTTTATSTTATTTARDSGESGVGDGIAVPADFQFLLDLLKTSNKTSRQHAPRQFKHQRSDVDPDKDPDIFFFFQCACREKKANFVVTRPSYEMHDRFTKLLRDIHTHLKQCDEVRSSLSLEQREQLVAMDLASYYRKGSEKYPVIEKAFLAKLQGINPGLNLFPHRYDLGFDFPAPAAAAGKPKDDYDEDTGEDEYDDTAQVN